MAYRPGDGVSQLEHIMRNDPGVPDRFPRTPIDPELRRRRRRRALLVTAGVIVILLVLGGGYVGWALHAPVASAVATTTTPKIATPPAAAIALPSEGAAAISIAGAEAYLGAGAGGIWTSSGTDEARPIASIAKLVEALVILDRHPLATADAAGPTLTFSAADHALYDHYYVMNAAVAPMPTGTRLSLHDALAAMLLPSAANYSDALATWAFGSTAGYASAARRWLATNNLTHTRIVEPTGLDARNTSTPSDLIAIGKLAAAQPAIAQISAQTGIVLDGIGTLQNTNNLIGTGGVTGLKTGGLDATGYDLLYTADLSVGLPAPLKVTGVVVGSGSHSGANNAALALMKSITAGFHEVTVGTAGDTVGSYALPWGTSARMVLADTARLLTWSDTPITVTMHTHAPATGMDGEVVGSVTYTAGPNTATIPVKIAGSLGTPSEWWRLTHPLELGAPGS